MFKTTIIDLEKEAQEFKRFLSDRTGSFKTNLYKTIAVSDLNNQGKLASAFPAEVFIHSMYSNGFIASIYYFYTIDGEQVTEQHKIEVAKMLYGEEYVEHVYMGGNDE